MASTYSTDLRIELIGAGEQSGTWGSTTNTNLGTLVEDAISGNATVSVTASPRALTALNGAVDEARQAILTLTTTLTAAFTVLAPPVPKQYVVYNNTAYTATIGNATAINGTTPTGGTTVAIPAGRTVTVWSDGSNISPQNNHLPGVPTSATAAPGTSTTQIATTAFVTNVAGSLGTMSSQNANAVAITGGTISGAILGAYPVGSIYMNASNATNPASLLGFGTWAALGAGRMLLGNGGGFSAGGTGGASTTTLSTANLPSHTHTATVSDSGHSHQLDSEGATAGANQVGDAFGAGTSAGGFTSTVTTGITVSNSSTGSGTAATTISPYLVVYMWQRVS